MRHSLVMDSPIGPLTLTEADGCLTRLDFGALELPRAQTPLLLEAKRQLEAYFRGGLRVFSLPLRMEGTPFQRQVWDALKDIPYGGTRTYADIARSVGREKAVRAVGGANHANPVPIIVPCHRVIGANGSLTGYGGGLHIKEYLLRLERENGGDTV